MLDTWEINIDWEPLVIEWEPINIEWVIDKSLFA